MTSPIKISGLLLVLIVSLPYAFADESCKISELTTAEASGQNFAVKIDDQNKLLFVAMYDSPPEKRQAAFRILDQSQSYNQMIAQLRNLYASDKVNLLNVSSNVLFITEKLISSAFDFIIVDVSRETFAEQERLANLFNLADWDYQFRSGQNYNEAIRSMIPVIAGAPAYVKATNPNLFVNLDFSSAPDVAEVPRKQIKEKKTEGRADQKYEDVLDDFRHAPRTRRHFVKYAHLVKSHHYAGMSDAEVRERVLPHFWSSARGRVRRWLDLELAEQRGGREKTSPSKPKINSFAKEMLNKYGKGLIFVPQESFAKVKSDVADLCKAKNNRD